MNDVDVAALAQSLRARARALPDDWVIEVLASCASTSSALLERSDATSRALFALEQTAGRGRRGRHWTARPGDSLTFSLRHRFDLRADALSGLSLAVGVALADALAAQGFDGIALKWPNDLMRGGGKLGGILIELSSAPAGAAAATTAVIGIGINLAPPPDADYAYPPAALFDGAPDREGWSNVAAAAVDALAIALPRFAAEGFAAFHDRWNRCNLHAGREVAVSGDGRSMRGVCRGADRDGALLLDCGGRIERVLAGDVSLRAEH